MWLIFGVFPTRENETEVVLRCKIRQLFVECHTRTSAWCNRACLCTCESSLTHAHCARSRGMWIMPHKKMSWGFFKALRLSFFKSVICCCLWECVLCFEWQRKRERKRVFLHLCRKRKARGEERGIKSGASQIQRAPGTVRPEVMPCMTVCIETAWTVFQMDTEDEWQNRSRIIFVILSNAWTIQFCILQWKYPLRMAGVDRSLTDKTRTGCDWHHGKANGCRWQDSWNLISTVNSSSNVRFTLEVLQYLPFVRSGGAIFKDVAPSVFMDGFQLLIEIKSSWMDCFCRYGWVGKH